jgi:alpha-glucosidase
MLSGLKLLKLLALVLLSAIAAAAADVTVASPDGRVRFVLSSGAQGHLEYTVSFNSKNIVDTSPLGIVVDGVDLAGGAQIGKADTYSVKETYPWYGPHSTAVDNCNGVKVAVTHPKTGTAYTLEIRAYDNGIAFRHLVPGQAPARQTRLLSSAFRQEASSPRRTTSPATRASTRGEPPATPSRA